MEKKEWPARERWPLGISAWLGRSVFDDGEVLLENVGAIEDVVEDARRAERLFQIFEGHRGEAGGFRLARLPFAGVFAELRAQVRDGVRAFHGGGHDDLMRDGGLPRVSRGRTLMGSSEAGDLQTKLLFEEIEVGGGGLRLVAVVDEVLDVHLVVDEHEDEVRKAHREGAADDHDQEARPVLAEKRWEDAKEEDRPRETDGGLTHLAGDGVFEVDFRVGHGLRPVLCDLQRKRILGQDKPAPTLSSFLCRFLLAPRRLALVVAGSANHPVVRWLFGVVYLRVDVKKSIHQKSSKIFGLLVFVLQHVRA